MPPPDDTPDIAPPPGEDRPEDRPRPLGEHFGELRRRVLICLSSVLALAAAGWARFDLLNAAVLRPLATAGTRLGRAITPPTMRPTEGFVYLVKLGLYFGLVAASPIILYQAWRFAAPGLTRKEKRALRPVFAAGALFFLAGAAAAYFYVIPAALFYLGWIDKRLGFQSYWRVGEYSSFVFNLVLVFGLAFELPLVMGALGLAGLVRPRMLMRPVRYVIAAAFVLGALLTPPDVSTQLMMAAALIGLYAIGVAFAWAGYRWSGAERSGRDAPGNGPAP